MATCTQTTPSPASSRSPSPEAVIVVSEAGDAPDDGVASASASSTPSSGDKRPIGDLTDPFGDEPEVSPAKKAKKKPLNLMEKLKAALDGRNDRALQFLAAEQKKEQLKKEKEELRKIAAAKAKKAKAEAAQRLKEQIGFLTDGKRSAWPKGMKPEPVPQKNKEGEEVLKMPAPVSLKSLINNCIMQIMLDQDKAIQAQLLKGETPYLPESVKSFELQFEIKNPNMTMELWYQVYLKEIKRWFAETSKSALAGLPIKNVTFEDGLVNLKFEIELDEYLH